MDRSRLLTLALALVAALTFTASARAADGAQWPLEHTPLVLAPDACAADPICADYVARRDVATATETPAQRSAREAAVLVFRPSRSVTRRIDAVFARAFDFDVLAPRMPRALLARLRRATDAAALRPLLRRKLAARGGWSDRNLGDLLAFQTISTWEQITGQRIPKASANAFRDGVRDLLARSPRTRRISRANRQLAGETSALLAVASERIVAAFPASMRRELRGQIYPALLSLSATTFGVDLLQLRPAPNGFTSQATM
jgi:hypothetical protein